MCVPVSPSLAVCGFWANGRQCEMHVLSREDPQNCRIQRYLESLSCTVGNQGRGGGRKENWGSCDFCLKFCFKYLVSET